MEKAKVNGVELEYEVNGIGRAGPADQHRPHRGQLLAVPCRRRRWPSRYRLITYRQRGQAGSTHGPAPVSFAAARGRRRRAARPPRRPSRPRRRSLHGRGHRPPAGRRPSRARPLAGPAGAAAAGRAERRGLLREGGAGAGGVRRGRPRGGHGGVPERGVQPRLGDLPDGHREARPRRRGAGDEGRRHLLRQLPAGPQRMAVRARAGSRHLASRCCRCWARRPSSCSSTATTLLHAWFPQVEDCTIEGVAHLLHLQRPEPVARGVAEFFARHPIGGGA